MYKNAKFQFVSILLNQNNYFCIWMSKSPTNKISKKYSFRMYSSWIGKLYWLTANQIRHLDTFHGSVKWKPIMALFKVCSFVWAYLNSKKLPNYTQLWCIYGHDIIFSHKLNLFLVMNCKKITRANKIFE